MLEWLRTKFLGSTAKPAVPQLPPLERDRVAHLFVDREGLPQVDWGFAELWIRKQAGDGTDEQLLRRALVGVWLAALRDTLDQDHQAWRSLMVEGLTPIVGGFGAGLLNAAEKSFGELRKSLIMIRGDEPIPPVALVAISPMEQYISFTSHFMPESGSWATSGGCYLRRELAGFPTIAIDTANKHAAAACVAHELTHHALVDCRLPLWAEEGITQMMEERVTGHTNFSVNPEMAMKQRERWAGDQVEMYVEGEGFSSPDGEDQQLSYHLSQWVVRSALDSRPKEFFAFLRACRSQDPELASREHLGMAQAQFVQKVAGISHD